MAQALNYVESASVCMVYAVYDELYATHPLSILDVPHPGITTVTYPVRCLLTGKFWSLNTNMTMFAVAK